METRRDHKRDYELWDGADYFAELKRQILLLTADDTIGCNHRPSPVNEYRGRAYGHRGRWDWYEKRNNCPMLSKQMHLPLTGNGTGVFIPHIIPSRICHSGGTNQRRRKVNNKTEPPPRIDRIEEYE